MFYIRGKIWIKFSLKSFWLKNDFFPPFFNNYFFLFSDTYKIGKIQLQNVIKIQFQSSW